VVGVPLTATYKNAVVERARYLWFRKSETGLFEPIQDGNQSTYKLTTKDFNYIIKCVMIQPEETKVLATLTQNPVSVVDGYGVLLKLNLMDGRNLESKDIFTRKSDPSCLLTMGKQKCRSRIKRRTLSPVWNEHHEFRTTFPVTEKIKLSLFSWERFTDQRPMGSTLLDLSDLKIGEVTNRTVKLENCRSGEVNMTFQVVFINNDEKPAEKSDK